MERQGRAAAAKSSVHARVSKKDLRLIVGKTHEMSSRSSQGYSKDRHHGAQKKAVSSSNSPSKNGFRKGTDLTHDTNTSPPDIHKWNSARKHGEPMFKVTQENLTQWGGRTSPQRESRIAGTEAQQFAFSCHRRLSRFREGMKRTHARRRTADIWHALKT